MATDLLASEHAALLAHATTLVADLNRARSRYRPGETSHSWHMEWGDRLVNLSNHLGAIFELTVSRRYPSAFVLARTSLEQHLIDRLVFLGSKVTQEYHPNKDTPRERTEALLDEWKADDDNPTIEWQRIRGSRNYLLIYRGYVLDKHPQQTMSEYFFLDQQYDPFHGRAKHQQYLQRNFWTVEDHVEWADESAVLWKKRFNPTALIQNLVINDLISDHEAMQIDIHFGFLSAFTHPTGAGYGIVQPRRSAAASAPSDYDHYASELLLLYVIRLADVELSAFEAAFQRPPACRLDWDSVRERQLEARPHADHFWFLGGTPHAYDRAVAANDRMFDATGGEGIMRAERVDPNAVADDDIGYARNPLERIVQMHSGFREMTTGIEYRSPWPRADAQLR